MPNPPGGSSDANARILADALTKILKQPVIVNFKPGVGGQVGNSFVAKAKPDGYTLLMGLSSIMVSPDAERAQGKTSLYEVNQDRKSTRLNSSHSGESRMPSSA